MTAVIGVLNKAAVAIAADSAVTFTSPDGKRKILNNANKIFNLSRCHPVGLAIYNSSEFMNTPWETLIKIYRKQLNEKCFNKLIDYKEDFLNFIKLNDVVPKSTAETDHQRVMNLKNVILNQNEPLIKEELKKENRDINSENIKNVFENILSKVSINEIAPDAKIPAFQDYSFEEFESKYNTFIYRTLSILSFDKIPIEISELSKRKIAFQIYLSIVTGYEFNYNYTGLIFIGFGEKDLFPSLDSILITNYFDGRLATIPGESSYVGENNISYPGVYPFAQVDVINTILRGIEPAFENQIYLTIEEVLRKYHESIVGVLSDQFGNISPVIGDIIKNNLTKIPIDGLLKEVKNVNENIKNEKFIKPLLNAIVSLSKEDLAEMAESMIHMTFLKRRITSSEESVGGPVDVAIISKGDGFVWIKRKHYFSAELNPAYFKNNFH